MAAGLTLPTLPTVARLLPHRGSLSHLPSVQREQSSAVPVGNCVPAIIPIHALDPITPIVYTVGMRGTKPLRHTPENRR